MQNTSYTAPNSPTSPTSPNSPNSPVCILPLTRTGLLLLIISCMRGKISAYQTLALLTCLATVLLLFEAPGSYPFT